VSARLDPFGCFGELIEYRHDIYKWHADQQRAARQRAVSFHALRAPQDPAFEHIHEPGGFRRNYLLLRADEQGDSVPPMTETFIDFLTLFGHFVSPYTTTLS
jgi:proton-coupled amino acid transporter